MRPWIDPHNDKSHHPFRKPLWATCDTFRGTISVDTFKDFILTNGLHFGKSGRIPTKR